MPKWDFGVEIPLTVKTYYDADTVPGWDLRHERSTVLKVTPMEIEKYLGKFKFQKIDTVYEGMKIKLELESNMLRIYNQDTTNKARWVQVPLSRKRLRYDFDFKGSYIYIDDKSISRVILYDPKDSILIFTVYSATYKYEK